MAKLAITCGLPRSGMTTRAKSLEHEGWVRVCPDDIRLAVHGRPFVRESESAVWAIARTLLQADGRVLIDATNHTRKSRSSWRRLADEFGIVLDIFLVETPFGVCLERNTGAGPVPPDVLDPMNRAFQRPTESGGRITLGWPL